MTQRYFVDERGGCIAVRDRTLTDTEYQGLHPDTAGVVWYRTGEFIRHCCPHCAKEAFSEWIVPKKLLDEAHEVCARLNSESMEAAR